MVLARGCWLLLHVVALLGAWVTRLASASSTCSTSASSWPAATEGRALVLETGDTRSLGFGSFALSVLSVVVDGGAWVL